MAIRDVSGLPDDHPMVPAWVRAARERARNARRMVCGTCGETRSRRNELLGHLKMNPGHVPLVREDFNDRFLRVIVHPVDAPRTEERP
jgi:hypothetical protein